MKKTFMCDETMVITIPIGRVKGIRGDQTMPEKFQCVYKDFYKVFVINGKPKPLGAAQAITGLFIVGLTIIMAFSNDLYEGLMNLPSLVFVVSGLLCFAAGHAPNMHVSKLSFALNIICFFWSLVGIGINVTITIFTAPRHPHNHQLLSGTYILILILLVAELFTSVYLIYWLSKAICRQHFNLLPVILLKQVD